MSSRPDLSRICFDGCGLNGPDQYRTRIATFRPHAETQFGPAIARACQSHAELLHALEELSSYVGGHDVTDPTHPCAIARTAIANARKPANPSP